MKSRALATAVAFAAVCVVAVGPAQPARAAAVCTWGGTPDAPTGEVYIKPGSPVIGATRDLKLLATGPLEGDDPRCTGTMTFKGVVQAGSGCLATLFFEGKVHGVPGVDRFWGPGVTGLVAELLYDKAGNVVGSDQPQLFLQKDDRSQAEDCATDEGFTRGRFSSIVEFFGEPE